MYFNRFDIVTAHYAFCCDYHEGQASELYARLCRIQRYYRPSPLFKGFASLNENEQAIYQQLLEKHNYTRLDAAEGE